MSKKEKLVEKFYSLPSEMRYDDVKKVLEYFGFEHVNTKGSHFVFMRGEQIITIPKKHGKTVKREYLKKLKKMIEE